MKGAQFVPIEIPTNWRKTVLPKRTYMLSMRMVTDIIYSKVDILISPKMTAYVLTAWFTESQNEMICLYTELYFFNFGSSVDVEIKMNVTVLYKEKHACLGCVYTRHC